MRFMKGIAPVRRTLNYLNAGNLFMKEQIKVMSINYNTFGEHHKGVRDFVFWQVPQVQYKNPGVQLVTLKNMTPSPFIRFYYENGDQLLVDVDSRSDSQILKHLIKVVGKSQAQLDAERKLAEKTENPADFGMHCVKPCICEIPGQIPCPGVVPLPNHMRGKYKYAKE